MKFKKRVLLIAILVYNLCSCTQKEVTSNRIYFTFDQEDRKIVLPLHMEDSVKVRLIFDTGDGLGYNYEFLTLDTSVLSCNPTLSLNKELGTLPWGSSWGQKTKSSIFYDSELKVKIGNTDFIYAGICAMPFQEHMNSTLYDGVFNIPRNDTLHIWELNFENNYMEIHSAKGYAFPSDCMLFPLVGSYNPFFVTLPLKIKFPDNDTLTLNQKFLIDTGAARDIVLLSGAKELEFLNKREDAVWINFLDGYVRYYTGNATVFGNRKMDSLRIYTIDYKNRINITDYIIGLNFLKRFNVFFDMKNRQLGLQPIHNFQRLVNPLYERFHYSTQKTEERKFIVDKIGNYKENYYKSAGLQIGDEMVTINGIPYGDTTREIRDSLKRQDTLTLEIIRNGRPLTLSVPIDHNEPKGD